MTSTREIEARLSDLEGSTPDGEALSIASVLSSMNAGVDPRERHGGYIPGDVAKAVRGCFHAEVEGSADEEDLTDEEWWTVVLDSVEMLGEDSP